MRIFVEELVRGALKILFQAITSLEGIYSLSFYKETQEPPLFLPRQIVVISANLQHY